jgi:phage gpG-like protein
MPDGISLAMKLDDNGSLDRIKRAIRLTIAPRPLLDAFGKMLTTSAHHRFETATDPEGRPWKPLAESTRRARVKAATRRKRGDKQSAFVGGKYNRELGVAISFGSAMAQLGTGVQPRFITGRSEQSITYHATETSLDVGSNYKFPGGKKSALAIQELGGQAGRGHAVTIPARPAIGVSTRDESAMADLTELYFGSI